MFSLSFVSRIFFFNFHFDFFSNLLVIWKHIVYSPSVCVFLQFFSCTWDLVSLLWLGKMLNRISIFLNLLGFDLWPKMWSILENVLWALEKKVYSSEFGWNSLKISMRSISSNVSFKSWASLLIYCFDDLSIGVTGVLKSPTVIVLLSISPFMSVSVCLMYWGAPMLGA